MVGLHLPKELDPQKALKIEPAVDSMIKFTTFMDDPIM